MNAYTAIATGNLYQPYLDAARQNLEALRKLALLDPEFFHAADSLLTAFKDYADDCQAIIDRPDFPEAESDLVEWPTSDEARALANRGAC